LISTSLASSLNNNSCTPNLAVLVMTFYMQREREREREITLNTGNRTTTVENKLPYTIHNFKYRFVPFICLLRNISRRCTSPRRNTFSVKFILHRFCSEGKVAMKFTNVFYLVHRIKNARHFPTLLNAISMYCA